MTAYSGRWSPTVTQAERRARRARERHICRCVTNPETAPCEECEAKAEEQAERAAEARETGRGEDW
jgi:hypothetical protein